MNEFTVEIDKEEKKFGFRMATLKDNEEAQAIYNRTFKKAIDNDAMIKPKLEEFLRKEGIWDDEKEAKKTSLQKEMSICRKQIAEGGIKLSVARELAIKALKLQNDLRAVLAPRHAYDNVTADAQADNIYFNYMVAALTIDEHGKPVFKDLANYLDKLDKNDKVAITAAVKYASYKHGFEENLMESLPEVQFLKEYSFMDDEGRLLDKDGNFVDEDGHRVNDSGELIDEDGDLIDFAGNKLNKDGSYKVNKRPFLDDDGNDIVKEQVEEKPEEDDKQEEDKDGENNKSP